MVEAREMVYPHIFLPYYSINAVGVRDVRLLKSGAPVLNNAIGIEHSAVSLAGQ
jgi:hypothetical protein